MNLTQIILLEKMVYKAVNQLEVIENILETSIIYSSQTDSAGGRGKKSGKQDIDAPQASDDKRKKKDNTGKAQGEDISNKAKDQKEGASITDPDTNLTGDTGNLDIGQTDLGASGTGTEDL